MFVVYTFTNENSFIFLSYKICMKNISAKKAIAQTGFFKGDFGDQNGHFKSLLSLVQKKIAPVAHFLFFFSYILPLWRTTTVVLAHMGVVDGCRCCSRDSARRYFRRCWPLLSPLFSPFVAPAIKVINTGADSFLAETQFLILYLLV